MQTVQLQNLDFTGEKASSVKKTKDSAKQPSSFKAMLESMGRENSDVTESAKTKKTPEASSADKKVKDVKKVSVEKETVVNENTPQTEEPENIQNTENSDFVIPVQLFSQENVQTAKPLSKDAVAFVEELTQSVEFKTNVSETAYTASDNLTLDQLSYLKSSEEEDSFEALFASAEEYSDFLGEKEKLSGAQNLSVEDPEAFLEMARVAQETQNVPEKNVFEKESNSGIKNLFSKRTKESVKESQTSLFTITDERSVTEKLSMLDNVKDLNAEELLKADDIHLDGNSLTLSVNLSDNAQQNILSLDSQTAAADGSVFQQMLTQQIETNAPDFVKAGSIVLKDNNQGTINMNLRPESLGNVKISLQLSDKGITGEITVATKEAYEAFKQNLNVLKEAFVQNGFDSASLNLNLASNADTNFMQQGQQAQDETARMAANRTFGNYVAASEDDLSVESVIPFSKSGGDYKVDMIA